MEKKQKSTLDAVKLSSRARGQGYHQHVHTLRATVQKEGPQDRWSASLSWDPLLFHHRAQCWWTFVHLHFSHLLCCFSILTNALTTPTQCWLHHFHTVSSKDDTVQRVRLGGNQAINELDPLYLSQVIKVNISSDSHVYKGTLLRWCHENGSLPL